MNPPKISGSKEKGRRLFQEKGCIKCHYPDNPYKAPSIAEKNLFIVKMLSLLHCGTMHHEWRKFYTQKVRVSPNSQLLR